jgi:hypothetical protein
MSALHSVNDDPKRYTVTLTHKKREIQAVVLVEAVAGTPTQLKVVISICFVPANIVNSDVLWILVQACFLNAHYPCYTAINGLKDGLTLSACDENGNSVDMTAYQDKGSSLKLSSRINNAIWADELTRVCLAQSTSRYM